MSLKWFGLTCTKMDLITHVTNLLEGIALLQTATKVVLKGFCKKKQNTYEHVGRGTRSYM